MVLHLPHRFAVSLALAVSITGAAYVMTSVTGKHTLVHWWLEDGPPLHGTMRIVLYTGLLLTALLSHYARPPFGDSPLQAPELWAYTYPQFFSLEVRIVTFTHSYHTEPYQLNNVACDVDTN